ncbi:mitochondrial 39-S ribosomal protein l47 (MRP-L47) domain-containing protein [Sarocladium implicatum]|nr:mitochondrial 39-S ribosomal protein l47 (MRP-L47) domain-containing protein [Sarocladium implicatum]
MATPGALRNMAGRVVPARALPNASSIARSPSYAAPFSTTASLCKRKRKTRDNNPQRGVSSLYGSGPRYRLSVSDMQLPKPADYKPEIDVDKNHGLWGFFPEPGKLLLTPSETEEHGRAWTVEELRRKSWEDLHSLWWVCVRERNMLATSKTELNKTRLGFGEREFELRDIEVRKTMRAIKHALTERQYTWEDAVEVAKSDPEIQITEDNRITYQPSAYEEEVDEVDGWVEVEKDAPGTLADAAPQPKSPEVTR